MGRRKRYLKAKAHEYPGLVFPVLEGLENHAGRWLERAFGGLDSLQLEIGAGRGLFATSLARRFPRVGFLVLEIKADRCMRIADRVLAEGLDNVRILCGGLEGLEPLLAAGECERFWMNFPDPWPKKRHARRRMPRRELLASLRSRAAGSAHLHLRTDSGALHEWVRTQLPGSGWVEIPEPCEDPYWIEARELRTEYEIDFRERGIAIHYLHLRATLSPRRNSFPAN